MSITNIVITTVDTAAMVLDQLNPQGNSSSNESLMRTARYIDGLAEGAFYYNTVVEQVGAIQATATITSTGTASNDETASICNQTITAKTSGADPTLGQFNISGTVATQATNIAAAINGLPALAAFVTATSALGVVTITAKAAGTVGNAYQLSEALSNVTATQFTGGTNGTATTLS